MTTNLERIRQMNSKELAECMKCTNCYECIITKNECINICDGEMTCKDVIKQWLEQEVEE